MGDEDRGLDVVLSEDKIPFMHWGIINKYNFSRDKLPLIPRKVFDKLFLDVGYGFFSYISPIRGFRPKAISTSGRVSKDIFKDIIEGKDYAIFIAIDQKFLDNTFSVQPCLTNVTGNQVVTIINRFPSMVRVIDEEILNNIDLNNIAWGVNLVSFPIRYFETLSNMDTSIICSLIWTMMISIKGVLKNSLDKGFDKSIIYPFFNIGFLAGGSQPRIHSQTYIDLTGYGLGLRFRKLVEAFEKKCYLCNIDEEEISYEDESWRIWVNSAPRRNYEFRIVYREHVEDFTELKFKDVRSLSIILRKISEILDRLGVDNNRNILFYTKPLIDGVKDFHIFVEILPFEVIGGVELLDSCRVVRMNPSVLAEKVREMMKE